MLTVFSIPKAFTGHIGVIQRNAIRSWMKLHPEIEIILFGSDQGTAEVARECGVRHEPNVKRNEFGSMLVNSVFGKAQAMSRYETLCYVNCDIVLMNDFLDAVAQTKAKHKEFLMVGRRWDTDIREAIDFSSADWEEQTRQRALAADRQRDVWWVDYFVFPKGFYGRDVPPFAIGRTTWDNWLVWKGRESGRLIDASASVVAVHQNHDYGHHRQGAKGVWKGEEAKRNFQLAGGWDHVCSIEDAELLLQGTKFLKNPVRLSLDLKRYLRVRKWKQALVYRLWLPLWHSLLGATRPLRTAMGLRSKNLS